MALSSWFKENDGQWQQYCVREELFEILPRGMWGFSCGDPSIYSSSIREDPNSYSRHNFSASRKISAESTIALRVNGKHWTGREDPFKNLLEAWLSEWSNGLNGNSPHLLSYAERSKILLTSQDGEDIP